MPPCCTTGQLLPGTLVSDVPLNLNGFSPQNYNKTFYGAVPAHRAIERSLNVPLVRMLSAYNTGRFMVAAEKGGHDHAALSENITGFADPGRRRRDVMGPHRHVCFTGAYARTLPDLQRAV